MMLGVSLNGFQARADHSDYLMVAEANQLRQGLSHVLLIIGNQYAHTDIRLQADRRRSAVGRRRMVLGT